MANWTTNTIYLPIKDKIEVDKINKIIEDDENSKLINISLNDKEGIMKILLLYKYSPAIFVAEKISILINEDILKLHTIYEDEEEEDFFYKKGREIFIDNNSYNNDELSTNNDEYEIKNIGD